MSFTKQHTGDDPIRVNKWLAQSGVCSRREAESLISKGEVLIDGDVVQDVGRKIEPGQTLTLKSSGQKSLDQAISVILNKPVGYVSAQPDKGQTAAAKLLTADNMISDGEAPGRNVRLAPAGRLDQDSRGLLLLTQDGVLTKAIIGPTSSVDKEYLVTVTGKITAEKVSRLRHGLKLDGKALLPAKVIHETDMNDGKTLRFVLNEGKKRQIRRMCELVHLHVVDLLRIRIGPITLGGLAEGKWRCLTPKELSEVIAYQPPTNPKSVRVKSKNKRP